MKISIITVCFNSAKTLENTIISVSNQTYSNIEYIIIDGNSSDSTVEIIKRHNNVISKWISEPDNGLYDAMNKGIQISTGDLIGIVNSDDVFNSHTVVAEIVEFHKTNSIEASIGNIVQQNASGKVVRFYSSANWKPEKLKFGLMPPHPSIFFKRILFEKYGNYLLNFKIGGDYELITRFFLKNSILWEYSAITTHKMLVGGVSSSGFKSYKLITNEIENALQLNNIRFNKIHIKMRFLLKLIGYVIKKE